MSIVQRNFERVARVDDIPVDGYERIEHGDHDILVFRDGASVYCVLNRCPHAGKPLMGGRYAAGKINCPVHGAVFYVKTGAVLAPPATRPASCLPARVSGEYIEVDFANLNRSNVAN